MGLEDQELFYSPEHKDRRDLHNYEIDDICEVVQLKSYLRRERQIAETRLKAIEQRDELIAALTANKAQSDEGRLDALESRLNSEIRERSDLTGKLQRYHSQIEEYRNTLRRIVAKVEALVKREAWRLPEHMRPTSVLLSNDDVSPASYLKTTSLLLERLDGIVAQVIQAGCAEVQKAATDIGSIDRWKRLVQDREADLANAQQNITALSATNKLFENNIKVAESQARSLQEALEQAHSVADKDAETVRKLKAMLEVSQNRGTELANACDCLKRELQDCHERDTMNQIELLRLRDIVAAHSTQVNPIVITPSQDVSQSNEDVEIHDIASADEPSSVPDVSRGSMPQMRSGHSVSIHEYYESRTQEMSETSHDLFYTARNTREDNDPLREHSTVPSRGTRATRRKKQASPTEMPSSETMATEARADGSSSIGTSPDSLATNSRSTRPKKSPTEQSTAKASGSPPRRRTRRAAI